MIHILCADIASAEEDTYRYLYARASAERQARADRCRRFGDKLRCVTAEALLKKLLGPEPYRIGKTDSGKPCIMDREDVFFNLSHSGRYVVIAWGNTEVGVDVQKQDPSVNTRAIAERFFSPEELSFVRQDPSRFYEIWTGKESYLKYTGKGLREDLRSFSVLSPPPGLRYHHCTLEGGYSLSLCTTEEDYTLEILDVRQLIP